MTSSPESMKREEFIPGRYPGELEANFVVVTGATLRMRPIRDEDAQKLIEFHARLSFDSIYRRYFSIHPELSPMRCDTSRRSTTWIA